MFRNNRTMSRPRPRSMWFLLLALAALPGIALAQGTGGLPYESGLSQLVESITGPVAFGTSVIGVVAAGAMLIFGGDMNGFMRSIVFLVLVIGLIVSATSILSTMFNVTGTGTAFVGPLMSGLA